MSDELVDVRLALAASPNVRVELGRDGVLHVLTGPVTIHLDRARYEELATTLARAVVTLAQIHPRSERPPLSLLRGASAEVPESPARSYEESAR